MTRTFARKAEPTAEVIYGRRVLTEAAALIRDGQVGGLPEDLSSHEATRVRAEIAGWFEFVAKTLKNVSPQ